MKRIVLFILIAYSIALSSLSASAQTIGDYRTAGSGNWASPGTWEIFTGLSWIPAVSSPTSLGGKINIRNTHTVTVNTNRTVDEVTVDAGGTLVLSSNTLTLDILGLGDLVCNGTLQMSGGDLNMNLTNTVTVNGTMLWTDGDLIAGTVNVMNGGTLTLNTAATKDLQSSTINVGLGGAMNWDDGDINLNILGGINNNGTINTSCDKSISGLGTFNNNSGGIFRKTSTGTTSFNVIVTSILGTFKGYGTYDFNNLFLNAGTISPGLSPGIVLVTYADLDPLNYPLLGSNSDMDIEIKDGSGPGTGHDQVQKNGDLKLGGTLRVTEIGTVPDGTYAIVLVTGNISGSFDNVILPAGYTLDIQTKIVLVTKTTGTLPVKLTNFSVKKIDKSVQLNWQTATENNSDHFEIERSKTGNTFEKIGEVNAAGNSNQLLNYQFIDNDPNKGVNTYRLKQIDKDNKFEYSSTRWVKIDDTKDQLYVFPTITNGVVSVISSEKTIIELYNLQGIRLLKKEINNQEQLDLSNYAPGVYFIHNNKDGRSYKLIKR